MEKIDKMTTKKAKKEQAMRPVLPLIYFVYNQITIDTRYLIFINLQSYPANKISRY